MSTVEKIERDVLRLSSDELREFRDGFVEHDAAEWDRQFDRDAAAGKLDAPADEALRDQIKPRVLEGALSEVPGA